MAKPILLTGFRPTGDLHLGHYLSLIDPLIQLKNDYQIYVMVADLHAHTELRKPKVNYQCFSEEIKNNTLFAAQIISSFLPTDDFVIFRQSDLKEYHLDLFYKLLMVSRHSLTFGNPVFIDAMQTELFKEIDLLKLDSEVKRVLKWYIGEHQEILYGNINDNHTLEIARHLDIPAIYGRANQGLLDKTIKHLNTRIGVMGFATYPLLMAADILLYNPAYTLVGNDQSPHIQITNELVKILKNTFGIKLPPAKGMIWTQSTLKGCDGSKMSKTLGNHVTINQIIKDVFESSLPSSAKDYFMRLRNHPHTKGSCGDPNQCVCAEYFKAFGIEADDLFEQCCSGLVTCVECKNYLYEKIKDKIRANYIHRTYFVDTDKLLSEGAQVARQRITEGELVRSNFIN